MGEAAFRCCLFCRCRQAYRTIWSTYFRTPQQMGNLFWTPYLPYFYQMPAFVVFLSNRLCRDFVETLSRPNRDLRHHTPIIILLEFQPTTKQNVILLSSDKTAFLMAVWQSPPRIPHIAKTKSMATIIHKIFLMADHWVNLF